MNDKDKCNLVGCPVVKPCHSCESLRLQLAEAEKEIKARKLSFETLKEAHKIKEAQIQDRDDEIKILRQDQGNMTAELDVFEAKVKELESRKDWECNCGCCRCFPDDKD